MIGSMKSRTGQLFVLALLSLATTFVVWLPFFLRLPSFLGIPLPQEGMATIMRNFDGPYYLVVAKTLYQPALITTQFSFPLPAVYYAAHYPLFPLLIRVLGNFLSFPQAMLSITVGSSILATVLFYHFLEELGFRREAFWLSTVFLLLPARWLVVRSIGSPEPLFLALIIGSFIFFRRRNYWAAGIFGALAQITKPPAVLIFAGFGIYLLWKAWKESNKNLSKTLTNFEWKAYPLLLIPGALLTLFYFYGQVYGDFLAYFHSGDNIHLFWPPLQAFSKAQAWVGTFWLEEIVWLFLLGALTVLYLIKVRFWDLASFAGVFFLSVLFVAHRDIARYSLPLLPFAIVAFAPLLSRREFKIALAILLLPIYLFSLNFIAGNATPIADWTPFL